MRNILVAFALVTFLPAQSLQLSTGSGGGERHPVVSADGQVVAYLAIVNGQREVFTVPIGGGTPTQQTTGANVIVNRSTFSSWPSLSISASGRWISYWDANGVQVIDTVNTKTTQVGVDRFIPHPHVDALSDVVVWQSAVNGAFEVMINSLSAPGAAVQLTTGSGAGSRFPQARNRRVVFQKPVSGFQEVFVYDGRNQQTRQVSQNSGPGNRYARLSLDGEQVVYEALVNGTKEVVVVPSSGGTPNTLTSLTARGDRLPMLTGDAQVVFEGPNNDDLEIYRIDDNGKNSTVLLGNAGGGLRRASTDRHGHVVVYQAPVGAVLEVFRLRLCPEATWLSYGVHGKPSQGQFVSFRRWHRCNLTLGLRTSLSQGTKGLFVLSARKVFPGIPFPGAPGSFVYVGLDLLLPASADAAGTMLLTVPVDPSTKGVGYYQWAVFDTTANSAGLVTSEGTQINL